MKATISVVAEIIICLCSANYLYAEDNGLYLQINPIEDRLVVGMPLVLDVTLGNKGPIEVPVVQLLDIVYGSCKYYVSEDGKTYRMIIPRVFFDWEPTAKPLSPNSVIKHEQVLLFDPRKGDLIFSHSGAYFVKLSLGKLESNIVKVMVAEPDEHLKKTNLYLLLQNKDILKDLQWPLAKQIADPIEDKLLATCISEKNIYTKIIACLISERIISHDYDREKADKLLKILDAADTDNFAWRSKAIFLKSKIYASLGDKTNENIQLKRLQDNFPSSYSAWLCSKKSKTLPASSPALSTDKTPIPITTQPVAALEENKIKELVASFRNAWVNGDEQKCLSLISDDFIYGVSQTKNDLSRENKEFIAKQKHITESGGTFEWKMNVIELWMQKDELAARIVISATKDGEALGRTTEQIWVFKKCNDQWLISRMTNASLSKQ